MTETQHTRCAAILQSDGFHALRCTRKGVVEDETGWHCKQHSDAYKVARRAKSKAKWDETAKGWERARERDAEERRRADCYPDLLAALEVILPDAEGYVRTNGAGRGATNRIKQRCDQAREAVKLAKGE